ncbi:MAG: hypothetical protein JJU13_14210 [Balneolaceae bacterium]|nr:hypothetical protein [Balneolaceae bacterium]
MNLNNRIDRLEETSSNGLPYPLNYLKGKISNDDFQFIKDSEIRFRDAMFIDSEGEEIERYRTICENAGLLPPLNFEQ